LEEAIRGPRLAIPSADPDEAKQHFCGPRKENWLNVIAGTANQDLTPACGRPENKNNSR
jgi:hypothetical protein